MPKGIMLLGWVLNHLCGNINAGDFRSPGLFDLAGVKSLADLTGPRRMPGGAERPAAR